MYFWTECQNQGSIYNNINTFITHIGLLFCFLARLVAGFRAGMFIMGCVCLWGKQLMWKSFIFINPNITVCQQRPMTCNIFTEAGRREQAVTSFSFITEDKEVPAEGTCWPLASSWENSYPCPLRSPRECQSLLQDYYSCPCWTVWISIQCCH